MNKREIAKAELSELIAAFREAGEVYGANVENGDYRIANKASDLARAIYAELKLRGEQSQRELLPLLEDKDPGVRLDAAACVLEFSPEKAVSVLEALIRRGGVVGLMAKATLSDWQRGGPKPS